MSNYYIFHKRKFVESSFTSKECPKPEGILREEDPAKVWVEEEEEEEPLAEEEEAIEKSLDKWL